MYKTGTEIMIAAGEHEYTKYHKRFVLSLDPAQMMDYIESRIDELRDQVNRIQFYNEHGWPIEG